LEDRMSGPAVPGRGSGGTGTPGSGPLRGRAAAKRDRERRATVRRRRIATSARTSQRAKLIRECDRMLRAIVLARDRTCQLAAAGLGKCGGPLQVCHVLPKGRYRSLRHDTDNVLLGCWRHHSPLSPISWHSNPRSYALWFDAAYPERAIRLDLISRTMRRVDLKLVLLELQQRVLEL